MENYREEQFFPLWSYAAVLAAPVLILGYGIVEGCPSLFFFIMGGPPLLLGLLIANLLYMKTTTTEEALEVRFGYFFTCYRKRLPLNEIRLEGPVTYRPLLDAGGWGIRWGRFDGQACRYLNARGNEGVLISTPESRFIIGAQDPVSLAEALAEAGCACG